MPVYLYEDDSGQAVELAMSIPEMEARQRADGTIVDAGRILKRNMGGELRRARGCVEVDHASEALGVNSPEELAEAVVNDRANFGPERPDYYDRRGKAHWTGEIQSVLHRKRLYMRKLGMVDRDSYV